MKQEGGAEARDAGAAAEVFPGGGDDLGEAEGFARGDGAGIEFRFLTDECGDEVGIEGMFGAVAEEGGAVGEGEGELPETGGGLVEREVEIARDVVLDVADGLVGGVAGAGEGGEFEGGDLRLSVVGGAEFQFGFGLGVESRGGEDLGAGDAGFGEGVWLKVRGRRERGAGQALEEAGERGRRRRRREGEG